MIKDKWQKGKTQNFFLSLEFRAITEVQYSGIRALVDLSPQGSKLPGIQAPSGGLSFESCVDPVVFLVHKELIATFFKFTFDFTKSCLIYKTQVIKPFHNNTLIIISVLFLGEKHWNIPPSNWQRPSEINIGNGHKGQRPRIQEHFYN